MKSKPEYENLSPDFGAARHVFLVEGAKGTLEALKARREIMRRSAAAGYAEQPEVRILALEPDPSKADTTTQLIDVFETSACLNLAIAQELKTASMGSAFYIAGSEAFIWSIQGPLRAAGIGERRIRVSLTGSAARSVYCVHCGAIDHGVTSSIHSCCGCGTPLMIRDHFSRRIGAYMGFRVDAETPGAVPAVEQVYL